MLTVQDISSLREQLSAWRQHGESIAFVPTMGNLHAGHMRLVKEAKQHARRVVVSIFVNPLQFGSGEDLDAYPRTPAEDATQLEQGGVDLLFIPVEQTIYPYGQKDVTQVEVPRIGEILCGNSRPGHFRGVATVVCKLFNLVQPDVACFGKKDFQQLAVLRQMVRDLAIPVELIGVDTVRENDGLAMSSRNAYLTPAERQKAAALYQSLRIIGGKLSAGEEDFARLEEEGKALLQQAGMLPDYFSIRCAEDLRPAEVGVASLVILAAAYLGRARLIDNLLI